MGKDQIQGLIGAIVVIVLMFFGMGGHSDEKKIISRSLDTQLAGLNEWFSEYQEQDTDRHPNQKYFSAMTGYSRDQKTLLVNVSKSALDEFNISEQEMQKYAFDILDQYPGSLASFDNLTEEKELRSQNQEDAPVSYIVVE